MYFSIFVFLIFKNEADQKNVSSINCNEEIYNSNCNCSFDDTSNQLVITCSDFSSNDEIKLPNISAQNVKVVSGLKKWPNLPKIFFYTTTNIILHNYKNFLSYINDLNDYSN